MILEYLQNFRQLNRGDNQGTVWATKNIDPEINGGKINVSRVLGFRTNTDDKANLGAPAWGFAFSSDIGTTDRYFAVADDRCWETSTTNPNAPWTEMASTPTDIDANSDIIAFNAKLYIATQNNLKSFDGNYGGGTFADISGGLGASPHSLCVYANRLYVSDLDEKVYSMDTAETLSKTGSNTIDLNTVTGINQVITKILAVSDGIWIATLYADKAGGEMIFWDGVTENASSARYKIPRGALTMVIKDDRPYIVDSLGRVRVFDGTSFTEIARFPIRDEALDGLNSNGNDRFIHPNGMITVNDEIYILANNTMQDTTQKSLERMPAGVWAWNSEKGLYHKYSFVDTDITDSTLTDYGAGELAAVGALFNSDATGGSAVDRDDQSEIMAGIQYYSDATTTKAAIGITNVQNTIKKAGYLVTAEVTAEGMDELWKEIALVHDRLKNSTDRIIIKVRTKVDTPIYGTGTWSSDTILRSSSDLSTVVNGDEVEILRGKGAGACYDIDSITGNYRLQLAENTLTGMSGTVSFRITNWKQIAEVDTTDTSFIKKVIDEASGGLLQIKVFIVGTGMSPQLVKLMSNSSNNTKFN